jgi:hypothetical protein
MSTLKITSRNRINYKTEKGCPMMDGLIEFLDQDIIKCKDLSFETVFDFFPEMKTKCKKDALYKANLATLIRRYANFAPPSPNTITPGNMIAKVVFFDVDGSILRSIDSNADVKKKPAGNPKKKKKKTNKKKSNGQK